MEELEFVGLQFSVSNCLKRGFLKLELFEVKSAFFELLQLGIMGFFHSSLGVLRVDETSKELQEVVIVGLHRYSGVYSLYGGREAVQQLRKDSLNETLETLEEVELALITFALDVGTVTGKKLCIELSHISDDGLIEDVRA